MIAAIQLGCFGFSLTCEEGEEVKEKEELSLCFVFPGCDVGGLCLWKEQCCLFLERHEVTVTRPQFIHVGGA